MKLLTKYKSKRHFEETPEPKGAIRGQKKVKHLIFTVQKHAASHLHYDFRLECDGVLKSWAVPKGPSMNPSDKRLAIMVEDHPYDYWDFEGIIPKGNYGAGTVMLWDTGTYTSISLPSSRKTSEAVIRSGLEKGHLDIVLNGEKLKGEFALIRLANSENQWLLMKKKDEYAQKTDVTKQDRSVKTHRSLEEISGGDTNEPSDSLAKLIAEAPKGKMPLKVNPMLGVLVEKPFDRPEWVFEIKWDGYRALAQLNKGKVLLYSRNQKSFNEIFSDVVEELRQIKVDAVLDGEMVVLDNKGKPQFQLMQNFQRTQEGIACYYVFDILHVNGRDLRALPLLKRKAILKLILDESNLSSVKYCDHIEKEGIAFFKQIKKMNLEGMMAKDGDSPYVTKRSSYWQKIKTHLRQEVIIGGFTQPKGSREKIGALLVGVNQGKKLIYAGHVGGGFTQKLLRDVYEKLHPLITKKSPFEIEIKPNSPVSWVKPKLVCEVSFAEWTSEGIMRQPIFKGLRFDKDPSNVVKEIPK